MTEPTHNTDRTNWNVSYDVAPIRIRDPVAEALAVLDPGEPFVIDYHDVVTAAGHSCPTAAGAYRIAQFGLAALYPDALPARSDVAVTAGGPKDDPTYGVMSRLISYVTGAAETDGFGGLAGGHGDRQNRLHFAEFDVDPAFEIERVDTDDAVRVTYRVDDIPSPGPGIQYLQGVIDGTATDEERDAFAEAWHRRVRAVLTDDDLFAIKRTSRAAD